MPLNGTIPETQCRLTLSKDLIQFKDTGDETVFDVPASSIKTISSNQLYRVILKTQENGYALFTYDTYHIIVRSQFTLRALGSPFCYYKLLFNEVNEKKCQKLIARIRDNGYAIKVQPTNRALAIIAEVMSGGTY